MARLNAANARWRCFFTRGEQADAVESPSGLAPVEETLVPAAMVARTRKTNAAPALPLEQVHRVELAHKLALFDCQHRPIILTLRLMVPEARLQSTEHGL